MFSGHGLKDLKLRLRQSEVTVKVLDELHFCWCQWFADAFDPKQFVLQGGAIAGSFYDRDGPDMWVSKTADRPFRGVHQSVALEEELLTGADCVEKDQLFHIVMVGGGVKIHILFCGILHVQDHIDAVFRFRERQAAAVIIGGLWTDADIHAGPGDGILVQSLCLGMPEMGLGVTDVAYQKAQVDLSVQDKAGDSVSVRLHQVEVDILVLVQIVGLQYQVVNEIQLLRSDEQPGTAGAGFVAEIALKGVDRSEDTMGVVVKALPLRRQLHTVGFADQKLYPIFFFQRRNRLGQAGLTDKKFRGGLGDRAVLDDLQKIFELLQRHSSACLLKNLCFFIDFYYRSKISRISWLF